MNLRKLGLILACLVMLTGIGTVAHASDVDQGAQPLGKMKTILKSNHFGKEWGFSLGVKAWANDWSLPLEVKSSPTATTTSIVQFDSDMEVAFIPTGLVRYKNFFIGGSYMPGTDYDFNQQTVNETTISQINGEREEWDLNIGYFLTPNLAVTLGYKKIERELTLMSESSTNDVVGYPLSADAPIIGLAASLPINEKFSFYGNFAYGLLSGDAQYVVGSNEPTNMDLDGNYYLAELGFNYVIPIKKVVSGIAINLGYRFQRLEIEMTDTVGGPWNGSAGDQNDTTSGFTFGVSVSF